MAFPLPRPRGFREVLLMTTLFNRALTATLVLAAVAACGHHRGPRPPRHSSAAQADPASPAPAQAQAEVQAPPRPSPIPVASADVVIDQLTATPDTDESYPSLAPDGSLVLFMSLEAANRK